MKKRLTAAVFVVSMMLAACGKGGQEPEVTTKDEEHVRETEDEQEVNEAETPVAPEIQEETKDSLAKRMVGKYSYHYGAGDSGEEEFLILNVVEFGDNLYAYCGQAMAGDYSELEAYSFWAAEFVPKDASEMRSGDTDTVSVTELNFSVMSNAGKYWNGGIDGTITYTEDGLVFEGFDGDEFLCPEDDSRLFLKDERIEDVFPYLNDQWRAGDDELNGVWTTGGADPVYLAFEGSNMTMYQKKPDLEVFFARGGYEFEKGELNCTANCLGGGGMPVEWSAKYKVDGDSLSVTFKGDSLPDEISGRTILSRVKESDVHVIAADELDLDESSFAYFGNDGAGAYVASYPDGFYGIWISAGKEMTEETEKAEKLYEEGFDSYIAYSPEWDKLNTDPYYCVTAGRFDTEEEAEKVLADVQAAGYKDAYVKHSGKRKYSLMSYTNYGDANIYVSSDKVILKDIGVSEAGTWYPDIYQDTVYRMSLVIDKDTVFDESCDTSAFGNYQKGDTPLEWFKRNYELMENNTDEYLMYGPALSGVFVIGVNGDHIDRFFGSYWWD